MPKLADHENLTTFGKAWRLTWAVVSTIFVLPFLLISRALTRMGERSYEITSPQTRSIAMTAGNQPVVAPIEKDEIWDDYYANLHEAYNNMRCAFDETGLTQGQLAVRIDSDEGLVSRRLNGQENLTLKTLSIMGTGMGRRVSVQFIPYDLVGFTNQFRATPQHKPASTKTYATSGQSCGLVYGSTPYGIRATESRRCSTKTLSTRKRADMSILDNEGHDPNGLGNRRGTLAERPLLTRLRDVDRADDYARIEAADEIERLRAALKEIADWGETDECAAWGIERARRALGQQGGERG